MSRAVDGWNLALRGMKGQMAEALTDRSHDETPRGWSPDGRYILYREGGGIRDGRDYTHRLMIYDVETGEQRLLSDLTAKNAYDAQWSPDGTRIAFVASPEGVQEVFVIDADGANLVNLSRHDAVDLEPVWAPDGRHVAFTSDRLGNKDIFVVHADGTDLRQITDAPADEFEPVWLSVTTIIFVMLQPDGSQDLWAIDINSKELRRLTYTGNMVAVTTGPNQADARGWIDRLTITPPLDVVSPGQHVLLDLDAADVAGRPVETAGLPIRWSVSDSTVASLMDDGTLVAHSTGRTSVVATAGGWIADTVQLVSRDLENGAVTLLFYEDWTRGLHDDRWIQFGEPAPYSRPIGGPEGAGFFVNNGDDSFPSGVVSHRAFDPVDGLTLEVWASLPFDGRLFQHLIIGLTDYVPADGAWSGPDPLIELSVNGPNDSKGLVANVRVGSVNTYIPFIPTPEAWHLYTLQLDPDGTVSVVIDGKLHWRSTPRLEMDGLGPLHVVLSGRSKYVDISAGLLRVYYGSKFLLR
jgi:hypothetical protein